MDETYNRLPSHYKESWLGERAGWWGVTSFKILPSASEHSGKTRLFYSQQQSLKRNLNTALYCIKYSPWPNSVPSSQLRSEPWGQTETKPIVPRLMKPSSKCGVWAWRLYKRATLLIPTHIKPLPATLESAMSCSAKRVMITCFDHLLHKWRTTCSFQTRLGGSGTS